MADNKKPKLSYAESLKAQVGKVVPKKAEGESITVDIEGEEVTIPRGNMSDAQWANVKKREVKPVEKFSGDKLLVKRGTSRIAITREDQSDDEWKQATEDAKKDYGNLNVEEHFTPPEERGRGTEWGEGTIYPTKADYERLKNTPDSAAKKAELKTLQATEKSKREAASKPPPVEGPQEQKSRNKDLEDLQPEVSNTPNVRNPASFVPELAMGATPSQSNEEYNKDYQTSEMATPVEAQEIGNAIAGANATVGAVGKTAVSMLPGVQWVQAASRVLAPDPAPAAGAWPGAITNKQVSAAGLPPSPNMPAVKQAQAPLPVDPLGAGGSASLSMAHSGGGGGFVEAKSDPALMKNFAESARLAKQAQTDFGVSETDRMNQGDELIRRATEQRLVANQFASMEAELAVEAKLEGVKEADRVRGLQSAAQSEAEAASRVPTDPNRYWNNKDEGQKAAAIIAGALFGFTGQGMQWLQRLDGLIENDMRVQMADRTSKVQGLESKARGLGASAEWAMSKGASQAEAHLLGKQMRLDGLKAQLEDLTAQQTNLDRKSAGQQMLMGLADKRMGVDAQLYQMGEMKAHNTTTVNYQNAQLRIESEKLRVAAAKAGGKGRAVSPQLAARVANTRQMIATFDNMISLAQNKGFLDRMARSGTELIDSDEDGKLSQYRAGQNEIATLRAKSSLQKHESDLLVPLTRPRSGRFDPVPGLREGRERALRALNIELKSAEDAQVGDLGSPETSAAEGSDFPETDL